MMTWVAGAARRQPQVTRPPAFARIKWMFLAACVVFAVCSSQRGGGGSGALESSTSFVAPRRGLGEGAAAAAEAAALQNSSGVRPPLDSGVAAGNGDAANAKGGDDDDPFPAALRQLLNVSSLQNVSCDAVINVPNLTLQCAFVTIVPDCGDQVNLFDYLSFLYCSGSNAAYLGVFVLLVLWILVLILLLASTADIFFVPPMEFLSEKLKLSPDIAGITLLALGNGAPDVMTAISAGSHLDFNLLLTGLLGASIFIGSGILACVIFASANLKVDSSAFYRDCVAYIVVTIAIIVVAIDGEIHLWEAVLFIGIYVVYVATVVTVSCLARQREQRVVANSIMAGTDDEFSLGMNLLLSDHSQDELRAPLDSQDASEDDDGRGAAAGGGGGGDDDSFGTARGGAGGAADDFEDDVYHPVAHRSMSTSLSSTDEMEFIGPAAGGGISSIDLDVLLGEDGEKMYRCGRGGGGRCCACRFYHLRGIMLPRADNDDDAADDDDEPSKGGSAAGRKTKKRQKKKNKNKNKKNKTGGEKGRRLSQQRGGCGAACCSKTMAVLGRLLFVVEWPFAALRWLSIPACDGKWDPVRRWCSVVAPLTMWAVVLLDCEGWAGFAYNGSIAYETVVLDDFPLWACLCACAAVLSIVIFATTARSDPYTLPGVYPLLVLLAFVASIVWMDLVADEAVAVLTTLGIGLDISTAILGLTVIAVGNSVGDLVADVVVARRGQGKMAVASCFGSPMLNDILGVGIALTIAASGDPDGIVVVEVHDQVKLAWIFLGTSLVSSLIGFPIMKMAPTKAFAGYLVCLYAVFMILAVLVELGTLDVGDLPGSTS